MTITVPIEIIIAILVGIGLCFFGYRLKKVAFAVIWFVVGYWLGKTYLPNLISNQFWLTILPIAIGALLSLVGLSIERIAVMGTAFVVVASFIIDHFGPITEWTLPAIAIAAGVVAGAIAIALMKPATIVITAIFGANLLGDAVAAMIPASAGIPYLSLIIFAILAIVGVSFQFNNAKNIV